MARTAAEYRISCLESHITTRLSSGLEISILRDSDWIESNQITNLLMEATARWVRPPKKTTSNLTFARLLISITFSRARLPGDVRIVSAVY
jgi:hypothetical protein